MADKLSDMKTGSGVEPYTPLTPGAALGGRRRKSYKLVTKKKARKVLKKLGMRLRGGDDNEEVAIPKVDETVSKTTPPPKDETMLGGRRRGRKGTKKVKKNGKGRSLFGMRY